MVKQIKCSQLNPQYGTISVHIRFIGKLIYMKFSNNNPQQEQLINQLRSKGVEIILGDKGWAQINIFKEESLIKLNDVEFDMNTISEEEVEQILYDFYKGKYLEAKFTVTDI